MIEAGCLRLGLDKVKWNEPDKVPLWLRPLDQNPEIITDEQRREIKANPIATAPVRRVSKSSYLS